MHGVLGKTVANVAPGLDWHVIGRYLRNIVLFRLWVVRQVALDSGLQVGVDPPEDVALAHTPAQAPHAVAPFIVAHRIRAMYRIGNTFDVVGVDEQRTA